MVYLQFKTLGPIGRPSHKVTGNRRDRTVGIGWEHLHVAIDDASRLAYTELLPSLGREDATGFLNRAVAWFGRLGISVERVMTDNGSAYRSQLFAGALAKAGIRHVRTRPYTPRTNGKAERFIQTSLREWAYAHTYQTSEQRSQHLPIWLHTYNWHRPHTSLKHQPPISRSGLDRNNLWRHHT